MWTHYLYSKAAISSLSLHIVAIWSFFYAQNANINDKYKLPDFPAQIIAFDIIYDHSQQTSLPLGESLNFAAARHPMPAQKSAQNITKMQNLHLNKKTVAVSNLSENNNQLLSVQDKRLVKNYKIASTSQTSSLASMDQALITPVLLQPARCIHTQSHTYPAEARSQNLTGTAFIELTLSDHGLIENVRIIKSSHHLILDNDALSRARTMACQPERYDYGTQPATINIAFDYESAEP